MAVLVAIDMAFLKNTSVYQNIHPHPYWIVILLIACRYGTVQGVFAGGLAAMVYIAIGANSGEINFSHDVFLHKRKGHEHGFQRIRYHSLRSWLIGGNHQM